MDEHVFDDRAGVQLGTVQSINDQGQAQTTTVKTSDGAVYSDVEVVQSYGVSGVPPIDGALALLFAIGGDPANLRAILFNPSVRFGGQLGGEMTLFAPDGTRVSVRQAGKVEIKAGNEVTIDAPDVTVTCTGTVNVSAQTVIIAGAGGIQLNGNVSVDGWIQTTGSIHAGGGVH